MAPKKDAKALKTVNIDTVFRLAVKDKRFFNQFTKDPVAAIEKQGWRLGPKDSAKIQGMFGVPCVFNVLDVIKRLKEMGWTWPDKPWKPIDPK